MARGILKGHLSNVRLCLLPVKERHMKASRARRGAESLFRLQRGQGCTQSSRHRFPRRLCRSPQTKEGTAMECENRIGVVAQRRFDQLPPRSDSSAHGAQRSAAQRSTTQRNATQRNTTPRNTAPHHTTPHCTTPHHTTPHNTTQRNTTPCNAIQHHHAPHSTHTPRTRHTTHTHTQHRVLQRHSATRARHNTITLSRTRPTSFQVARGLQGYTWTICLMRAIRQTGIWPRPMHFCVAVADAGGAAGCWLRAWVLACLRAAHTHCRTHQPPRATEKPLRATARVTGVRHFHVRG